MTCTLLGTMEDLIKILYRYSGKEGDKYKLNKKEMKNMLQEEFAELLNGSNDTVMVEKIMSGLDANKDGEMDFHEFAVLVFGLLPVMIFLWVVRTVTNESRAETELL